MKTLVLDNYDSFTYNLVHILRNLNVDVNVKRNDQVELKDLHKYSHVVVSPGPGVPRDAGKTLQVIAACEHQIPVLGICLGHQAIATHCGASIANMNKVFHGVKSTITKDHKSILFQGLPEEIQVGRYHSWEVVEDSVPEELQITARDSEGGIMAIECKQRKLYGLQFHPESIMTNHGETMINNFLKIEP